MSQLSRAIAHMIEEALRNYRPPAASVLGQLDGSQVAPPATGTRGTVAIATSTPNALGVASAGSLGTVSDAGHVHAHGSLGGGSLHSVATTGEAGFLSAADKTKIDSVASGASVASVGLSLPAIFSVSGSPVTGSGTISASLATQSANRVWAGPSSGSAAEPTFRALVSADIPTLPASRIVSGQLALARGGTGADLSATGGASQYLKQASVGGAVTVGTIAAADLPSHATYHQHGGADEVATATAAANAIPKAGAGGTLAIGWIPTGSTSSTVCIGNDSRLSNSRTPTAHATSHQNGGSDEIATATAAANAIPKAGVSGTLADGWLSANIARLDTVQYFAAIQYFNDRVFVQPTFDQSVNSRTALNITATRDSGAFANTMRALSASATNTSASSPSSGSRYVTAALIQASGEQTAGTNNGSGYLQGLSFSAFVQTDYTENQLQAMVGLYGAYDTGAHTIAATIATAYGLSLRLYNQGSSTITTSYGIRLAMSINSAATIGTHYGIYLDAVTNYTTAWGLYLLGAYGSYIAGYLNLGTTTSGHNHKLYLSGDASNAAMRVDGAGSLIAVGATNTAVLGKTPGSVSGTQAGWLKINLGGTDRYLPYW